MLDEWDDAEEAERLVRLETFVADDHGGLELGDFGERAGIPYSTKRTVVRLEVAPTTPPGAPTTEGKAALAE